MASIGSVEIKLLAQIGDAKPTEIGHMTMPIDMKTERRGFRGDGVGR